MTNFNRAYRLVIARKDSILSKIKNDRVLDSGVKESFLEEERQSLVFTEHQMTADIDYTRSSNNGDSGPAKINIFNVSPETLSMIKEEDTLYLYAGYQDQKEDLPLVFIGDISVVKTERKGSNFITTLICSDSRDIRTNLRVTGSAPPGATYGDAIQDLLNILAQNGLPTGQFHRDPIENIFQPTILPIQGQGQVSSVINGLKYTTERHPTARTLINGRNYEGSALEELGKLVKEINYEYYISLGKIYVVPRRTLFGSVIERNIITLGSSNLKSPIRLKKDASGKSLKENNKSGILIHTPLDARIKTETTDIVIKDYPPYDGQYKVETITHSLDYEGNKWDTHCYAVNR